MAELTYFAPAERLPASKVLEQRALFLAKCSADRVIDASDDIALVLNRQRQILYANRATSERLAIQDLGSIIGERPGEAAHCGTVCLGPGGCGTASGCKECGAVQAILATLKTKRPHVREYRLLTDKDQAFEFRARATRLDVEETPMVILVLRDITAEKRKDVMERMFFHDAMNTIGGIRGLAEMVREDGDEDGNVTILMSLADHLIDQLESFRELIEAEAGTLTVRFEQVQASTLLESVTDSLRSLAESGAVGLRTECPSDLFLKTDRLLIRRVLTNLAKNALEASGTGQVVTLSVCREEGEVVFRVRNEAYMPEKIQHQIFHRSFTTKQGGGHGLGSYGAKLMTVGYLQGRISFASSRTAGTTFEVRLPTER